MMTTMNIRQALGVWRELELALQGCNGFGGDTAEVYAYRLQENQPARGRGAPFLDDQYREADDAAARDLADLCNLFAEVAGAEVEIDGMTVGEWATTPGRFSHRVRVRCQPRARAGREP